MRRLLRREKRLAFGVLRDPRNDMILVFDIKHSCYNNVPRKMMAATVK